MLRIVVLILFCMLTAGCLEPLLKAPPAPAAAGGLPGRREFRRGQIVYHSDADVSADHALFAELAAFPEHVCRTLGLPVTDRITHVYLFADQPAFEEYFRREFRDLPSRRALFVMRRDGLGTSDEPRIFAFWGERIADDLRHELTHATLHGVLPEVPLWLDEGLAMYFEPGANARGQNVRALEGLAAEMNQGTWRADLDRLSTLNEVRHLRLADYHEAWAWVHFLLHGNAEDRRLLLRYLKSLRSPAPSLVTPWRAVRPDLDGDLLRHLRRVMDARTQWPHQ